MSCKNCEAEFAALRKQIAKSHDHATSIKIGMFGLMCMVAATIITQFRTMEYIVEIKNLLCTAQSVEQPSVFR